MGSGTHIGRVRGLGSAKEGAHHWWRQRVTAGSNLFLTLWFVFIRLLPSIATSEIKELVHHDQHHGGHSHEQGHGTGHDAPTARAEPEVG